MKIQHAENYWVIFNVNLGEYLVGRRKVSWQPVYAEFCSGAAMFESKLHAEDAIFRLRGVMDPAFEVRNLLTEFINQDATLYTQPELPLAQNEEEEKNDRRDEEPRLIRGGQRSGKTIAGAIAAQQRIRNGEGGVYDPRTKSFHGFAECK